MSKIGANEIRAGNALLHNGKLYVVSKTPEHTMPGKGGAFVQVEMRDIKNNTKIYERFRAVDTVEKADIYQSEYQFLYRNDDTISLMDNDTYDQIEVDASLFGISAQFLAEGMIVILEVYNSQPVNGRLPDHVICTVDQTEPVIKGQTITATFKPAILDNNVRIMVPPFIKIGDKLVVRTEDATYVERAK